MIRFRKEKGYSTAPYSVNISRRLRNAKSRINTAFFCC